MRVSAILFTPAIAKASAVRAVARELVPDMPRLEVQARDQKRRTDSRAKEQKAPPRSPASRSSAAVQAALADLRRGG